MKRTALLFIALTWPLQLCLAQVPTQIINHVVIGPPPPVPIPPHMHHYFFDPKQSARLPTAHHNHAFTSGNNLFHFQHHQRNNSTTTQNNQNSNSINPTTVSGHTGANIDSHHYIDLNLASALNDTKAGWLFRNDPVDINVGGKELAITSKSLITESEKLAAMQVLFTGHQSLLLDSQGSADGGSLTIGPRLSQHLSNLVIPQGVSVTDFSRSGTLNLVGNLNDSGSLNLIAGHSFSSSFSILAGSITVGSQGLISTPGNLNLFSGSGNIINNGTISSANGSINISAPKAANINVNASDGTFQANNGDINFRDASYAGASNINIAGGNYLSQQLNINLGSGTLNATVQNVTAIVNANAGAARLVSSTPNLQIGNWNIAGGDPTIANDNTITLTGNMFTNGAPITIVSGQNVVSYNPVTINTSSATTSGGNVNIIAGATFTPDPYSSGPISILGTSTTGGSINLNSGINTQALGTNGAGGSVVLAAFAGGTPGTGTITLPSSSTISTGGTGNGSPGHVYVIAGANTGSASAPGISIGTISTLSANESGGPGASGLAGGHIVLSTEQPNASINNPWVIDSSNGKSLVGGPLGGATAEAPISIAAITTGGGQVIVFSGLGITVGNSSTIGTNVISTVPAANSTFPGGAVSLIANVYGSTSPSVNTDIVVNGNIVTSGPSVNSGSPQSGNVVAMTTGSVTIGNITTSNASTTGSSTGGSIYIVAGSTNTAGAITVENINTSGQNAQSGSVELISMGQAGSNAGAILVGSINTSATDSSGAPITISSPGTIAVTGAIDSQGGNGNGGSLFIGSGAQSGTAINVANGSTINVSGTATGGGVYLLAGNAGDTITNGTITGASSTAISAYNPAITSITGNAGTITISFGTTNSFLNYVPGGYSQINDQIGTAGGVQFLVTTTGDPNVNIPLVSLNSPLTFLGASGSSSIIQSIHSVGSTAGYSLLSSNGIFVGSSNATLFSLSTFNNIGIIASNYGTVNVNNSNGGPLQAIFVGLATSASGPLSIVNNSILSISSTASASSSVTLGAGAFFGLFLSGSVTSASAITLIGIGPFSVSAVQNGPGTIGGATLNLINVNTPLNEINAQTTLDTDIGYLNVNTYTNSTISISNSNNVNVSVPQSGAFSLSSGGQINLTGPSAATSEFSLSTNANLAISQNITVTGPSARIDLKSGNTIIIGDGVSVNAIGTSTSGGLVQLAFSIPNGPLTVINNGIIEASNTNNTSVVGFNSGSSLYINVTGTGAILGSQVNFGNLDPTTLQMQGPFQIIASPLTGGFSYGNIYVQQSFILATAGFIRVSEPLISSSPLTLFNSNNQQNMLYEQIGTRIATDYTPWTAYWRQPLLYPHALQGGVSLNKIFQTNSALFAASEFNANELAVLSHAGIVFGPQSSNNFFDLVKGYVLFMPNKDIQVQTREGIAYVPKGAAAWIMETGSGCAIYDLHDSLHTGSIKVIVNKKELTLAPGKELLLTRNNNVDFADLNPGNELGYRNVGSTDLGDGIRAFVCDFSIIHGIVNVPTVHSLLSSKDPSQRKMAHSLFKNAAILADLTGYHDYETGQ